MTECFDEYEELYLEDDSLLYPDEDYYEPYASPDNYSMLNDRELRGFSYETFIQRETKDRAIEFDGNPTDPHEWKRQNNRHNKVDLVIHPIIWDDEYYELKFLDHYTGIVYPCWINRDWLPRADAAPEGKRMIYVTSNPYALDDECKELVRSRGELWSTIRYLKHLDYIKLMIQYVTALCTILNIIWLRYYNKTKNTTTQDNNRAPDNVFLLYSTQELASREPV